MRYASCTAEDIKFLQSRVASDRPGHPRLDSLKYRNVSVITSWNIHKDTINELGAKRFAEDTDQDLIEFFSIDRVSSRTVSKDKWKRCEEAAFGRIGPRLQSQLWTATPSTTSEHVPGCLRLCVGMPVMIKANEATELCITKGQEGIVRGWVDGIGPSGQRVLETLFVELSNPPRPIQIPDLPPNVVPIPRASTHITALLSDDTLLSLMRDQCMVLPNFAMTDYGSQGKSRKLNVVHLNNCKNHMSYYVALSRGNEADNTVIVQGFETSKITCGISGHLRQEFRELEILDEITRLRTCGRLPLEVSGIYRRQLLRSFALWKKDVSDPLHFHPSIQFDPRIDQDVPSETTYSRWEPSKDNEASSKKRKANEPRTVPAHAVPAMASLQPPVSTQPPQPTSKSKTYQSALAAVGGGARVQGPVGLIWNSSDWSCSYDSLLTPLAHLWQSNPSKWTTILGQLNPWLGAWANLMHSWAHTPEIPRDHMRRLLHGHNPAKFPWGRVGVKLDDLFMAVSNPASFGSGRSYCESCGYVSNQLTDTFGCYMSALSNRTLRAAHPYSPSLCDWFSSHFDQYVERCPRCTLIGRDTRLRRHTVLVSVPSLLIVGVDIHDLILDKTLTFRTSTSEKTLAIRGLIYHSQLAHHFTSIVVDHIGEA
ncbi:hypothetical protein C8R46DRAFT_895651 [Mycena filopes]|nr:hypothetical protein C8R46DRAFT_895651 [Mycena filopes]